MEQGAGRGKALRDLLDWHRSCVYRQMDGVYSRDLMLGVMQRSWSYISMRLVYRKDFGGRWGLVGGRSNGNEGYIYVYVWMHAL